MDRIKKAETKDILSKVLLAAALGIYTFAQALLHNPDPDSYFLIDLGRYIVSNRQLPQTAYWLVKPGVPTIVQQWLCDVINYMAYSMGGFTGTFVLGIVFNLILLAALLLYCNQEIKNRDVAINTSVFCWIVMSQFISTRPYALTIAASLLELVLIRRFFCKDDHKVRDYFTFYLGIFSVFVFQANWQASNLFYPFLWLFCFIPEIKERRLKVRLHACTAVAAGAAGSLVSPIGIKGPLYLYYSLGTLGDFHNIEIEHPDLLSVYTVLIIAVAALMIWAGLKRTLTTEQFFLAAGSILMSCVYMRCCWTLALPMAALLPNIRFEQRAHRIMRWGYIAAGTLCILQILNYNPVAAADTAMVQTLPPTGSVVLYTDFNSGTYFLIEGYKVYYDARPELYSPRIAKDKAFIEEAFNAWTGNIDYGKFISSYGFNWFAPTAGSAMDSYLADSSGYELVYTNSESSINIYRAIS